MAIVYATYFKAADAAKTAASLQYICRRPGRDLDAARDAGGTGRTVHAADGERLEQAEAGERFQRAIDAERAQRVYRVVLSTKDVPLLDADYHAVARAAFGERYLLVRHDGHSHPHAHVLARTDGRGLRVPELNAMRAHLGERERARERELGLERDRSQDRGRELAW